MSVEMVAKGHTSHMIHQILPNNFDFPAFRIHMKSAVSSS
jgi:hypothetical protein